MRACHRLTITLASLWFGLSSVSAFGRPPVLDRNHD